MAVIGIVGLIGVSMYASAAGMYMRTILYRFAIGKPIPDLGVDVGGAFGNPVRPSSERTARRQRGRPSGNLAPIAG